MTDEFKIKKILGEETLELRQKVLKPYLTKGECRFPEDLLNSTFHHGLFYNDHLIVIATMIQESHPDFPARLPYRLRGMATNFEFQSQGFGKKLLLASIENLIENNCDFLWFNARKIAFPFYESLGFESHGELFEMPQIGIHKVMYKRLNPS